MNHISHGTARQAALENLERFRRDGTWSGSGIDTVIKKYKLDGREAALTARLAPMNANTRRLALERAGETLTRRLELPAGAAAYLRETALALAPRVEAVLASGGGWQTIFPAFS